MKHYNEFLIMMTIEGANAEEFDYICKYTEEKLHGFHDKDIDPIVKSHEKKLFIVTIKTPPTDNGGWLYECSPCNKGTNELNGFFVPWKNKGELHESVMKEIKEGKITITNYSVYKRQEESSHA